MLKVVLVDPECRDRPAPRSPKGRRHTCMNSYTVKWPMRVAHLLCNSTHHVITQQHNTWLAQGWGDTCLQLFIHGYLARILRTKVERMSAIVSST